MSREKKQFENIWTGEQENTPRGPLLKHINALRSAFHDAQQTTKVLRQSDTVWISPVKQFSHLPLDSERSRSVPFDVKSSIDDTDTMRIAIQEATVKAKKNPEDNPIYEYLLNPDGTFVRLEELASSHIIESFSDTETSFVRTAVEMSTMEINRMNNNRKRDLEREKTSKQNEIRDRKRKIVKRITGTALVTIGLGAVSGGAYVGVQHFIVKPREADQAARDAFDQENHTLNGKNIEISGEELLIISSEKFLEIPTFRDGDSLESPRLVELDTTTSCAKIPVSVQDGYEAKVAAQEYEPLGGYEIVTYKSADLLTVCTTTELSSELKTEEPSLAVQLVRPQST